MKLSNIEKGMIAAVLIIIVLIVQPFAVPDYSGPLDLPAPEQIHLPKPEEIILSGKNGPIKIEAIAKYQVQAGVRSRKNYKSDYSAKVSPMDLVLAWGTLNQPKINTSIKYRQTGRWYYYNLKSDAPVSLGYVGLHSANTHIIPADDRVMRLLKRVKTNSYVELEGYLVNVHFAGGPWRTSLTREDSGSGACEIFYVTRAKIR